MPDLGVFSRYKSYGDYASEAESNNLKALLTQATLAKALKPEDFDIEKVGKEAFIKASQGMELSPTEAASLQYLDSKAQTMTFNPVTGTIEQRPSLLERAGIKGKPPAPNMASIPEFTGAPPAMGEGDFLADADPAAWQSVPIPDDLRAPDNSQSPAAPSEWDLEYQRQLQAAEGNPRLQQRIKEENAKAKISMTEAGAKTAGFADRMLQSNPIIDQTTEAATSPAQRAMGAIPLLGNYIVSGDYQSFSQAQRDFINAQLRRESGAAISPSEFDNAEKQYFPVPGDNEITLKQKSFNREAALRGMRRSAGPAYKPSPVMSKAKQDFESKKKGVVSWEDYFK